MILIVASLRMLSNPSNSFNCWVALYFRIIPLSKIPTTKWLQRVNRIIIIRSNSINEKQSITNTNIRTSFCVTKKLFFRKVTVVIESFLYFVTANWRSSLFYKDINSKTRSVIIENCCRNRLFMHRFNPVYLQNKTKQNKTKTHNHCNNIKIKNAIDSLVRSKNSSKICLEAKKPSTISEQD